MLLIIITYGIDIVIYHFTILTLDGGSCTLCTISAYSTVGSLLLMIMIGRAPPPPRGLVK